MKIACRKLNLTESELKSKLTNLYNDKLYSINMICNELKLSYSSVRSLLKECEIKKRQITKTPQTMRYGRSKFYEIYGFKTETDLRENLINQYHNNKLSQPLIAKKFGCTVGQISKQFRLLNIQTRSFSEGNELNIRENVIITHEQQQIINGALLGDGGLTRRKFVADFSYTCKHKSIVEDLQNRLPFEYCPIYTRIKPKKNGELSANHDLNTHGYKQLAVLYDKWYPKGIKIVPSDIRLTPLVCYWWYLGDGTTCKNELRLCTQGFDPAYVEFLISLFPVQAKIRFANKLPYIAILTDYMMDFLLYIGPCKHINLKHRWILKYGCNKNSIRTIEYKDLSGIN